MHKLLERQLRRHFGDLQAVPAAIEGLLADIDQAYDAADEDRRLLERSMELTSDELMQRNEALSRQVQEEHRIQEARATFINTAAHELGTPLTPLRLQVEVFKRRLGGQDTEQARSLAVVERSIDRLTRLVSDMLDASRLQSDGMELAPRESDLDALIGASVAGFHEYAAEVGVELRWRGIGHMPVWCDPDRIGQVVDNLLSNALKFTPAGGTIWITAGARKDRVRVSVRDSGIGIAPDEIGKLFHPFSQVHDTRSGPGGTGLGLFICRGIVEQGGGEIWAKSDGLGAGAEFVFTVPRAANT